MSSTMCVGRLDGKEKGEEGNVPTEAIPAHAPAPRRQGVLRFSLPVYVFSHYVITRGGRGWWWY